jgi:hypothetical protein
MKATVALLFDWQNLLVTLIVAWAIWTVARSFGRLFRQNQAACGGCHGCQHAEKSVNENLEWRAQLVNIGPAPKKGDS